MHGVSARPAPVPFFKGCQVLREISSACPTLLSPSPTEMSPQDDPDADLDVPTEIRRVIDCVLQDSIRPAFAIFSGRRSTGREGRDVMGDP